MFKQVEEYAHALEAIHRFMKGEEYGVSTFIDEVTTTYGYGKLDHNGSWEYELPQWFVDSDKFKAMRKV